MKRPFLASLTLLAGCAGPPEPPLAPAGGLDLLEACASALLEPATVRVDFGTPEADRFLVAGWGVPETTPGGRPFVWSTARSATLDVILPGTGAVEARIRARPFAFPDAPPQHATFLVNGREVGTVPLPRDPVPTRIVIPDGAVWPGLNLVEIRTAWVESPAERIGSTDTRTLGAAWEAIEFRTAVAPRCSPAEGTISLPYGTRAHLFLRVPPGSSLAWDRVPPPEGPVAEAPVAPPPKGTLRVALRSPGDGAEASWTPAPGERHLALSTPDFTPPTGIVRLTLEALPPEGVPGHAGGIEIAAPRVVSPPGGPPASLDTADRPDVFVIVVDALRADHVGAYGYPKPTTPRIDAFAAGATLFGEALAESSWTRPSVASLLTGLHPPSHGAVRWKDALPPSVRRVSEVLRDAGYATAMVTTNGNVSAEFGFDRGFDEFVYFAESTGGAVHQPASVAVEAALRTIDVLPANRPRFLYLHLTDPHSPYTPPPEQRARFAADVPEGPIGSEAWFASLDRPADPRVASQLAALYDAEIASADAQVGVLFDALSHGGLFDEAAIVVTADHGEEFGEHGGWKHGASLYREVLEIPLIARFPGAANAPSDAARAPATGRVQLVDLAPTLYALADVAIPPGLPGRDLRSPDAAPDRPAYAHLDSALRLRAVTTDDWKLVRTEGDSPQVLIFDRATDPLERTDVSAVHGADVARLAGLLDAHAAAQSPPWDASEALLDEALRERLAALGYLQ